MSDFYRRPNFNSSSNPGDPGGPRPPDCNISPESIRFIPETFGAPERSLAYLALRPFKWEPPKFVQEYRHLTLKEIDRLFENHLVTGGLSRGLTTYIFSKMHGILKQPPRWDRSSGSQRPLGAYHLSEFFAFHPEEDVQSWCWPASALVEAARKRAAISDPLFAIRWKELYPELLQSLRPHIYSPHAPEDITHSTWLAIHIAHDTAEPWDLQRLRRVALDIYNAESRGRLVRFFDELSYDPPLEKFPSRRIPGYVKLALLTTLLDRTRLPHEIVLFLYKFLTRQKPREIVKTASELPLFNLISDSFALFLPKTTIAEPLVREVFAQFDSHLTRPFRDVACSERHLNSHPLLLERQVGWTCLKDYFKGTTELQQSAEISHWWDAVLGHLQQQAEEPGTPLFTAVLRWKNEGGDFILTPWRTEFQEQEEDESDSGIGLRPDFSQRQHKSPKPQKPQKAQKAPKTQKSPKSHKSPKPPKSPKSDKSKKPRKPPNP